jgi:hypothetical protein
MCGSNVTADFAAGLTAHSESVGRLVVVGRVHFLTSRVDADALCEQSAVCFVVNKSGTETERGKSLAVQRLRDRAKPIPHTYLSGFDLVIPTVDNKPAILEPNDFLLDRQGDESW